MSAAQERDPTDARPSPAGRGAPARRGPTHERLVRRTRAAHQALHVHPDLARLLAPGLEFAHYRRVLDAQAGFLAAVEARRARVDRHPALALGGALAALERDLGRLPDAPRAFLELPVDPVAWSALLDSVEATGADPAACARMLDSAERTFEAFGAWVAAHVERGRGGERTG